MVWQYGLAIWSGNLVWQFGLAIWPGNINCKLKRFILLEILMSLQGRGARQLFYLIVFFY
jgi:hypothetical protein